MAIHFFGAIKLMNFFAYENLILLSALCIDGFLPMMYDMQCTSDDFPSRAHCLTRW